MYYVTNCLFFDKSHMLFLTSTWLNSPKRNKWQKNTHTHTQEIHSHLFIMIGYGCRQKSYKLTWVHCKSISTMERGRKMKFFANILSLTISCFFEFSTIAIFNLSDSVRFEACLLTRRFSSSMRISLTIRFIVSMSSRLAMLHMIAIFLRKSESQIVVTNKHSLKWNRKNC